MYNIKKIHPRIFIFKSAIKNCENIINYYNKNSEWRDWYTFGEMTNITNHDPNEYKDFPSESDWKNSLKENDYCVEIKKHFYNVTKIYFNEINNLPKNIKFSNFSIAKYFPNAGVSDNMAMHYHTDFQQERFRIPEYKFHTTCLFYLNDNYEGGEISFRVLNKDQTEIDFQIDYKPSSGDIVVFPSTPPFYHGVKKTLSGNKYIIRTYWLNLKKEDDYWIQGVKKYGEQEWNEKQNLIAKKINERPHAGFILNNNGVEEYYHGFRK